MADLGVTFVFGERAETVTRRGDALVCAMPSGVEIATEKVLVTAGRVGNTDGLGLEAVGVATDERGRIVVDEHFRTSRAEVYAAGDVIGFPALASTSMEQARVAVCHAFDFDYKQDLLEPAALRHLHDPGGEQRRSVGTRRRRARDRRRDRARLRSATMRAGRSSGTATG